MGTQMRTSQSRVPCSEVLNVSQPVDEVGLICGELCPSPWSLGLLSGHLVGRAHETRLTKSCLKSAPPSLLLNHCAHQRRKIQEDPPPFFFFFVSALFSSVSISSRLTFLYH